MAWVAFTGLILVLFARGVPIAVHELETPCTGTGCSAGALNFRPFTSPSANALHFYAIYNVAWDGVLLAMVVALSLILLLRRADQRIALVAAFMLVGFSGTVFSDAVTAVDLLGGVWYWTGAIAALIGSISIFPFLYMLPDGHFSPGWTRWAAFGWAIVCAIGYLAPPLPTFDAKRTNDVGFPAIALGFFLTAVVAQIWRYRRYASPSQRQQIKWVVGGAFAALSCLLLNILGLPLLGINTNGLAINYAGNTIFGIALLMVPAAIVMAIVKTHLWDIDRIINRALVYGGLSACLIAVYIGAVLLFERLFDPLTGQSDLSIALSTLMVAALFNPIRHRIQAIVDRRFYRQKYDAERALMRFGVAARDEVDLERLTGVLTTVIDETVQPTHLSVWLRDVGAG